ncbi:ATP-binding protein [Flavobacterium foetidum]|uniref:ATP-binding protein n=1 Tax=Flavobacterium foetidum TaxID=2026681 RepID=UPI001074D7CB|nr:tetratricopeptide repeat-containing sensor histidine kinase [Flavobacterium foetidum]KAF2506464.1 ATP-binding protein [Flavobacterium foetidum]
MILLHSCKENKEFVSNKKSNKETVKKLTAKADSLYFNDQYDSSYYYYNKAQLLCDVSVDYEEYAYLISSMAEIQSLYGDYITSEALLTKTLPYLKKIKKKQIVRNIYSFIGDNYHNMYDLENSIFYHTKALKIPGNPYKKALVLNDIAVAYIEQKKYEDAAGILEPLSRRKIVSITHPEFSDENYAYTLLNLGYCYFNLKKEGALELYQKSLELNLKHNFSLDLTQNYIYLSKYYEKDNPKLAHEYALKSYERACMDVSSANKTQALAQIIKVSNGKELKLHTLNYIKLIDSINQGRQKTKNQSANIKYNFTKDLEENLELKSQTIENEILLERQKSRNIVSYIIIASVLLLTAFLIFYLSWKNKKEKQETIYESEMRISEKLSETLSNDVYNLLSFSQNTDLKNEFNKEKLLHTLDNVYQRTRKISKENSIISTNENFQTELKEMISGFKNTNLNIIVNGLNDIQWHKIEKNKKITIFRVLQELLGQMKAESNATLTSLVFKNTSKNITLIYTDNRIGIQKENFFFRNGLQNVENRIKTIKGTLIFDTNERGIKLSFTFPL